MSNILKGECEQLNIRCDETAYNRGLADIATYQSIKLPKVVTIQYIAGSFLTPST